MKLRHARKAGNAPIHSPNEHGIFFTLLFYSSDVEIHDKTLVWIGVLYHLTQAIPFKRSLARRRRHQAREPIDYSPVLCKEDFPLVDACWTKSVDGRDDDGSVIVKAMSEVYVVSFSAGVITLRHE